MRPISSNAQYWGTEEERLDIQVLYVTTQPQKPPCFCDATTVIIDSKRGHVLRYRYSRPARRLVDIPEVSQLSPNRLHAMLRRVQMLVVLYDELNPVTTRIIKTIPFVANPGLRLSVLAGLASTAQPTASLADRFHGYHCLFASPHGDETIHVIRMLVEACTLPSPVSTDIADVQLVLNGAGDCAISVGEGKDPSSATKQALDQLRASKPIIRIFGALAASPTSANLEAFSTSSDVVRAYLCSEAREVIALQPDASLRDDYRFTVVASSNVAR